MAIGVVFEFPGVTQQQYDEVCSELNKGQPLRRLSDWPNAGVLAHMAGPTSNGWRVVDVWDSEASFQAFGERLMPILQAKNFPSVSPQIFHLHNFVKG